MYFNAHSVLLIREFLKCFWKNIIFTPHPASPPPQFLSFPLESLSGERRVVFAHLVTQNTRSPFSIQRAASPLITKYIVRGRRVGSSLLRLLSRPCTPFTVTVMDEWGSCRDMPGIKQTAKRDISHTDRALSQHHADLGPHSRSPSLEWFWPKGNQL